MGGGGALETPRQEKVKPESNSKPLNPKPQNPIDSKFRSPPGGSHGCMPAQPNRERHEGEGDAEASAACSVTSRAYGLKQTLSLGTVPNAVTSNSL